MLLETCIDKFGRRKKTITYSMSQSITVCHNISVAPYFGSNDNITYDYNPEALPPRYLIHYNAWTVGARKLSMRWVG